jgi:hypothetical protein
VNFSRKNGPGETPEFWEHEEMANGQCSIASCHRWWRFAQSFLKDAAPKAHPKMTIGN